MTNKEKEYLDPHSKTSKKKGLWGTFESSLRTFRSAGFMLMLAPIMFLYILAISLAIFLPIYMNMGLYSFLEGKSTILLAFGMSVSIACSYFLFAVSLLIVVPVINFLLPLRLKPMRVTWFSLEVLPWYYHNALVQLVRYTVLDFFAPTPFNIMFYRMMGMKVGKNVMINTSNISDPALIIIEDNVTIGGSATLFAHYGMKGFLVVEPTVIEKGATIGLKASLMGGVRVKEGVTVPPHAVLLPKTVYSKTPEKVISA